MRRKYLAGAGAAALGAATAVAVLAIGTTAGIAQTGTSSAFGVLLEGAVPFGPEPTVESTDGTVQTEDLVNIPLGDNGEIRAATLTAGDDAASVELAGVEVSGDPGSISVEVITVSCEGTSGETTVANLDLNGTPVVIPSTDPNTEIDLSPAAKIVINQQMTNADGTFTVNGLYIELLDTNQIITIASATCGGPADGDNGNGDNGDEGDGPSDDDDAPKPTPIETRLPVTG